LTQNLVILGAGGASREIAEAVEDINRREQRWNLLGFLDDEPTKIGRIIDGVRVLGPISAAARYSALFLIGIAAARNHGARRRVVETLKVRQDRFATIVHPSASVSRHAKVGWGSALLHNVIITPDAIIGNHVIVEYGAMIGHGALIEDFVTIAPGAIISGSVRICRGVFLGAGSVIRDGVTINEDALVGMGAVVVQDVASHSIVVGNPARSLPRTRV
jgi:sugar O-acyltransferase (sialic acid O-acetyltransferase NeuD family)